MKMLKTFNNFKNLKIFVFELIGNLRYSNIEGLKKYVCCILKNIHSLKLSTMNLKEYI